ncbi:MAG: hypothetical protein Q9223_000808 [Gallowayella weberi]
MTFAEQYPPCATVLRDDHTPKENVPRILSSPNAGDIDAVGFARSASYTQLPSQCVSSVTPGENFLRRTLSENVIVGPQGKAPHIAQKKTLNDSDQTPEATNRGEAEPNPAFPPTAGTDIAVSQSTLEPQVAEEDDLLELHVTRKPNERAKDGKTSSFSGSFSRLARGSWVSRSSSPSPLASDRDRQREAPSDTSASLFNSTLNTRVDSNSAGRPAKRRGRPLSALLGKMPSDTTVPSVPAVSSSLTTPKLPRVRSRALENATTVPNLTSWEPSQGIGSDTQRKKDELSSAFRTLEGDYQKFQSRTSSLKSAVIRSALLPFLRTYGNHPSNRTLRPEDLDRRVSILNKWWVGLLTMLSGRNGESVSGSDRPTVLDAASLIMIRPEWSLPYQANCSHSDLGARPVLNSHSTTSLASEFSNSSTASIFHNVQSIYAQNLLSQMAYVVEKMSSRSVPASVVAFCGKATAYAFFYCESIGDILVRLWATPPDMIKRVLAEHQLRRDEDFKDCLESVIPHFPSGLHRLGFRSIKSTMDQLRCQPHIPAAAAHISWHGPWVRRWAGRDTDLFFIFTRSYYNLMTTFLPNDIVPQRRLCAPGYVLLQAQILVNLDTIVLRGNNSSHLDLSFGPSFQYDDFLGEADASAPILPLPIPATNRSMAENRLIILLRDYLSGSCSLCEKSQKMFAESFESLLKAATRRVSVFNYNACFTLCDFMEEALAILSRYSTSSISSYTTPDWPFWLKVCRQMMESHNTMTEIRVYAFLYSVWGIITADTSRKHQVCLGWLLDEAYFNAQFNHWCPMVRAYYMRLLCWRVGRLGDFSSDVDTPVLEALARRLDGSWYTFLQLQEHALSEGAPRHSTAPCSPAPSRQLLIIRNDSQPTPSGMFLTFDSILSRPSSSPSRAYEQHGSLDTVTRAEGSLEAKKPAGIGKKSWSVLKNIMPFTTSAMDLPGSATGQTAVQPKSNKKPQSNTSWPSPSKPDRLERPAFRAHSFKFSLEWLGGEASPFGQERQLHRPRLPVPRPPSSRDEPSENAVDVSLHKTPSTAVMPSKYVGRALAEWEVLLEELDDFSDRRRAEGVPNTLMVETPTLGVETFRRLG